jgi:hypothetical protein
MRNNIIKTIIEDNKGTNFRRSFGTRSIKGFENSLRKNGDTTEQEINGNINIIYID